jgi:hypothetical protein
MDIALLPELRGRGVGPAPMLTRRRLLQLGAATWLTTFLGGGAGLARAAGLDFTAPAYLRRGAWAPLAGTAIGVAGTTLQLADVADLPRLAGRDDAFRLEFTGAADALAGGIHAFRHPTLGSASLFVSPVDSVVGRVQRYAVVVDRSVGVPRSVPSAPQAPAASPAPAAAPAPAATAPAAPRPRRRRRRRRRRLVRRTRRTTRAAWRRLIRHQAKIAR